MSIFFVASGVGMATVLIGGNRYALSIFLGSTLSNILGGLPVTTAMAMGMGSMLGAIAGVSLLRSRTSFDLSLSSLSDWLRLVIWGGCFACSISAVAGISSLLLGGFISTENYPDKIVEWWMGDTLGIIVITPFILTWWNARYSSMTIKELAEASLIIGLTYLVGQAIFLGWFQIYVGQVANAYWMFLLIIWVAVRLDTHWVTLVIVITSIQALQGVYSELGIFNSAFAVNKALNFWFFIIVFSVVGMTLSTFIATLKRTQIAQQEALERLQKIASRVPGVVFQSRMSADGYFSVPYSSEAAYDTFRLNPEEIREDASPVFTRIHPEDHASFIDSIQESARNLTNWLCEFRVQFDDGTIRSLSSNAIVQREEDGATLWYGFIADITQRKDNEQLLRTLAVAIEQSPTSVVITDLQADLLYVNPKFTEVTGYRLEEAIGQNPRLLHSGLTPDAVYVELWDTLLQGKVWHGELINQRKNGEIYWEDAYIAPAKDLSGVTTHYVGVKIEITERKLMEEKIHFLFDFSPIGFALNNLVTGQFIEINEAMFQGTGYSKREFLDLSYWDLTPREYETQEQQQLELLRRSGRYGPYEKEYIRKDGSRYPVLLNGMLMRDATGHELIWSIVENITERKQAEEALRRSETKHSTLYNSTSDAVMLLDKHGFFDCNKATLNMFGCATKEEFFSKHPADVSPPLQPCGTNSLILAEQQIATAMKNGSFQFEWIHKRVDTGAIFPAEVLLCPMNIDGKQILQASVRDITERKRVENQLRQSEMKLATLYNSTSDALMLLDEHGFFDCNKAALDIFGCATSKDIHFKHPAEVSPLKQACGIDSRILAEQRIATAMEKGSLRFEWIHKRVDTGKTFPAEVLLCTMILEGKKVLHVVVRDISERKRVENALKVSEERFRNTFELAPVGVVNVALNTRFMAVNRTFCDFLGYTHAELLSMTVMDVTRNDDKTAHAQLIKQLINGEISNFCVEKQYVRKDGMLAWGSLSVRLSYTADGCPDFFIVTVENIDTRKRIQNEILATKNQLQATLEAIPDTLFEIDAKGYFYNYYAPHKKLLIAAEQFMGKTIADVLPQEAAEVILVSLNEALQQGWSSGKQFKLAMPDGDFWFELSTSTKHAELGEEPHFIVISRDITERKHAEIELRIAATVFESQEGMLITDVDGFIIKVNQSFTNITGYSATEAIGKKPSILRSGRHDAAFYSIIWQSIEKTGAWRGEIWNRRKNGQIYPEWLTITAVSGNKDTVTHYVATLIDITERKAAEEYINQLAFYDPLTRLPNRRLLRERMKHGIEVSKRTETQMAVLMMDLDKFKAVNDTLGHAAGDELLQQVAVRIKSRLREVDMVARLGGDEFVVLMEHFEHYEVVARIAEDIIESLSQVFMLGENYEAHIGASIGISIYPEHGDSIEALMDNADAALYHAKDNGRACFAYFSEQLTRKAHERIALESRLRRAIKKNEFRVYWQPQVDIITGKIVGAEALLRWYDPVNGHLLPKDFIPLAEETGLIVTIGEWVLWETCKQGRKWLDQCLMPITLAVNVSPYQFRRCDINALVTHVLDKTGFPAEFLELEITETGLMENQEQALAILNNLHDQGVRIAIDDFGTGYSSLGYLKFFPLDILKIDKTFIDDIPFSENDMTITSTIISMAHHLGFKVLAEGVETQEQLAFLQEQGCDRYQGYFYNEALSSSAFSELLAKQ